MTLQLHSRAWTLCFQGLGENRGGSGVPSLSFLCCLPSACSLSREYKISLERPLKTFGLTSAVGPSQQHRGTIPPEEEVCDRPHLDSSEEGRTIRGGPGGDCLVAGTSSTEHDEAHAERGTRPLPHQDASPWAPRGFPPPGAPALLSRTGFTILVLVLQTSFERQTPCKKNKSLR